MGKKKSTNSVLGQGALTGAAVGGLLTQTGKDYKDWKGDGKMGGVLTGGGPGGALTQGDKLDKTYKEPVKGGVFKNFLSTKR
jgi:hypothetical protein